MKLLFKNLRYVTAAILLLCVSFGFLGQVRASLTAGFDGPLSNPMQYAFVFNKIILAALLAIVLIFDFEIKLPFWGRRFLRIFGITCVGLSLAGFAFLIRQQIDMIGLGWSLYIELYLFQAAYLMVSLILLGKSYEKNVILDGLKGENNA